MFYTLEGQNVLPCDSKKFEFDLKNSTSRELARTHISGKKTLVVTLFTGLNHSLIEGDDPLFFETVVSGGNFDAQAFRSSTYKEAQQLHDIIVDRIKNHKPAWYSNNHTTQSIKGE